jgi:predicted Fe-Mo cluster-binding NifX family protein
MRSQPGEPLTETPEGQDRDTQVKVAVASDDGLTIGQHFGRTSCYVVLTLEGGEIVSSEIRPKPGHHTFSRQERHGPQSQGRHGCDAGAQPRHEAMARVVADCQAVIAGGMGWGAFQGLQACGIEAVVTDAQDLREAVLRYAEGTLPNLVERLH